MAKNDLDYMIRLEVQAVLKEPLRQAAKLARAFEKPTDNRQVYVDRRKSPRRLDERRK
jgi:hypothetical protein